MLLIHFIVVVICTGQMLLYQSILFFICWVHDVKELCGTRVSQSPDVIRLCLLFYNICLLYILVLVLVTRVDDLAKACVEIKFILFSERTDLLSYIHSTLPITKSPLTKNWPITKENLCTRYIPFTYKYIGLNE